ncbi:hypothetical protein M433DRAFT_517201 [Acidomyces richmondensis BFW]|nr:MAG: hypothetical protein FE78DRAFT_331278 [Acidomyces sp. 'richmondensis']KYG50115.1 hypothetical protein M433DRAFT_517201 [Acidomyces richmondensis BFW]
MHILRVKEVGQLHLCIGFAKLLHLAGTPRFFEQRRMCKDYSCTAWHVQDGYELFVSIGNGWASANS